MSKRHLSAITVGLLGAALLVTAVLAQDDVPAVEWWVISGGGAPSTATSVTLNDTLGQPIIGPASGSGSVALSAGYWTGCVAAAAAVPVVTVTRSGADVVLSWPADPNSTRYQVFIATQPYFDPTAVTPVVTANTAYTDPGAAASLTNHFYVVRGLNACAAASASSARKGEFTYGLALGN